MRALITSRSREATAKNSRSVCLVAVEAGASAFNSYLTSDECDETIVTRQAERELPAEFSRRIIGRIGLIERSASCIGKAVIAVGHESDDQWMAARQLVARAMLLHLHASGPNAGELVLAVDIDADTHLRQGLLGLVETLVGEPESNRTPIRLRFVAGN